MTTQENNMNLTEKEIRLIAFEGKGVDTYNPNMMEDFSNRAYRLICKAANSGDVKTSNGYIIRRCLFLTSK